jgi:transposase-like protein
MTFNPRQAATTPESPKICPFCRSSELTTTSGTFDTTAYWRCQKCGEMWNAGRLQETGRYRERPRWR